MQTGKHVPWLCECVLLIIDGDENLSHNNNFVFTQKANQCRLSLSSHLTGSY